MFVQVMLVVRTVVREGVLAKGFIWKFQWAFPLLLERVVVLGRGRVVDEGVEGRVDMGFLGW